MTVSAHATDTYYCDTGDDTTGAGTKASPWQTFTKATVTLDGGSAGDRVLLCEGGVFDYSDNTVNTTCTANNPCYIMSYQPDDIAPEDVGVKPDIVVTIDPRKTGVNFGSGAAYIINKDYRIIADDWGIVGEREQAWGAFLAAETDHIVFDNMRFEDLGVGVHLLATALGDTPQVNVTIKNSHFENVWSVGMLGGMDNYHLIDNTFNLNGNNSGGRPIYLGGGTSYYGDDPDDTGHDYIVSGNVMTNSAPSDIGNGAYAGVWEAGTYGCNRTVLGGHGIMVNTTIKNNIVREDKETAALAPGGCWAYAIDTAWPETDEHFINLVFQNNEAYYAGNLMYSCSNCDGVIFRENIGYGVNGGTGILAANRDEDTAHPTETMYSYYNLIVQEKVDISNFQTGVESRHYIAAAVIADIEWNVFIFADSDANNRCTLTDSGSTVSNNFCFNVDGSGNFVVNTNYVTK